jgi:hypothetical protein
LHRISVSFLGGIYEGWPTYWDEAYVKYKVAGTSEWKTITPDMLYHEVK